LSNNSDTNVVIPCDIISEFTNDPTISFNTLPVGIELGQDMDGYDAGITMQSVPDGPHIIWGTVQITATVRQSVVIRFFAVIMFLGALAFPPSNSFMA
jgi:hypothetical protein